MGKTSIMANWISEHKLANHYSVYWIDCAMATEKLLDELKERLQKEQTASLLVWDHYENIAFGELDRYVLEINKVLVYNSRTCFITKGKIPDYVIGEIAMQRANVICGSELMFNAQEIKQYINVFKGCNLNIDANTIPSYLPTLPITLNLIVIEYEKHTQSISEVMNSAEDQLFWYLKCTIVDKWTEEEFDLIKRIYPFKIISKDIIRMLYGNDDKYKLLLQFVNKNCYIIRKDAEYYVIGGKLKTYFEKTFSVLLKKEEHESVNRVAIEYYEKEKDYEQVIRLSLNIKYYENALTAFIKLYKQNNTIEFRMRYDQYFSLIPKEVIAQNNEAVFWMCINSLVQLNLNSFTEWYQIFAERYHSSQLTPEKRLEMEKAFAFIKLISPYTTVEEFLQLIQNGYGSYNLSDISKRLFVYSELDMVTFMLLKRWNFQDGIEKFIDNAMAEEFLGEQLYSIVMVYLGIRYSQAFRSEEAVYCLNKGTDGCKKYNMNGPALYGELFLIDALWNQKMDRLDILGKKEIVIKKFVEQEEYLKRYDSFYIKILTQRHNIEKINIWISEQHSDVYDNHNLVNFKCVLEQIRVQILAESLYDAQLKLEALIKSCEEFHFEAERVECYLLSSIVCYRRDMLDKAVQYFLKAYWLAKQHSLNHIIMYEGVAIQPILILVLKRLPTVGYEKEFQVILDHANKRARYYPKYLMPKTNQNDVLTKTEVDILLELDSGDTLAQIAENRCISLNTVKQHTKNIYSKLKVNKRNMALKVAKERGII